MRKDIQQNTSIPEILENIEREYIREEDWEVKENANESRSFGNFLSYFLDKTLKHPSVLYKFFPKEAVEKHFAREIHIHKLPFSLYIPYCVGWSFANILKYGLKTPTLISKPAKHLDSAINHLVNFIFLTAQEWTGAMAISAFDLYIAPFVNHDNLDDKAIKQRLQSMLFELNYPSRMGFQSPFSNITIIIDTIKSILDSEAIVGGKKVGTLGDYIEDAIRVTKILITLYNEGDAVGSPMTFPIPTIMLTKDFDWNNTKWNGLIYDIFNNLARRGTFYLLNGYTTNVEALYAMCCRLTIDVAKVTTFNLNDIKKESEELYEFLQKDGYARGMWAIPDATGSIGVITINLPRLSYLAKGDEGKLEELLLEDMKLIRETLKVMRKRYERSLRLGLMPMTIRYLGTLSNHFSTFGLVGLPEAAATFLGKPNLWYNLDKDKVEEAVKWMKKIVSFVREVAEDYEKEDGILYNVEEVPAESTAYRMASADYKKYKEAVEKGDFFIPMDNGVPFYSNSIIPYYAKVSIFQRAKWEGEVQSEFTGGVMMHLFMYEVPDIEALIKLVKRIATETKIVYFSITPTIAVCSKCGWNSVGVFEKCPRCGEKVELWSRIVGYYRPLSSWNIGKVAEFRNRYHYSTINGLGKYAKDLLETS